MVHKFRNDVRYHEEPGARRWKEVQQGEGALLTSAPPVPETPVSAHSLRGQKNIFSNDILNAKAALQ